jgi:hypothetical protein
MNVLNSAELKEKSTKKSLAFKILWPSLERLSAATKLLFQVGAAVGGVLLLIYCGETGHYPVGATIADVLLLLAIAVASTALYSTFVVIFYGAGLTLVPLVRMILNPLLRRAHDKRTVNDEGHEKSPAKQIPKLDASEWLLGFAGLLLSIWIALIFWIREPSALLRLLAYLLLIAFLRAAYSVRKYDGKHSRRSNRDLFFMLGAIIFVFPLISGLTNPFNILPSAVRMIGVRKENVTVFVSNSRAALIDAETTGNKQKEVFGDYHRYENANVILRGIGTESVIEIDGRRWVIPNDQMVISYRQKKLEDHPTPPVGASPASPAAQH